MANNDIYLFLGERKGFLFKTTINHTNRRSCSGQFDNDVDQDYRINKSTLFLFAVYIQHQPIEMRYSWMPANFRQLYNFNWWTYLYRRVACSIDPIYLKCVFFFCFSSFHFFGETAIYLPRQSISRGFWFTAFFQANFYHVIYSPI